MYWIETPEQNCSIMGEKTFKVNLKCKWMDKWLTGNEARLFIRPANIGSFFQYLIVIKFGFDFHFSPCTFSFRLQF